MAASSSYTNVKETYRGSCIKRPKQLDIVGNGDFCSIPLCKNSTLDKYGNKTAIGFFSFPSDPQLRKKWSKIVSQFRRKGGKDGFSIKKTTKICEFHFAIEDIKISMGQNRKSLKTGSIPQIFSFKQKEEPPRRRSPHKRLREEAVDAILEDRQSKYLSCQNCQELLERIKDLENEVKTLTAKLATVTNENTLSKSEIENLQSDKTTQESKLENYKYNYNNISKNEKLFKQSTGLEVEAFNHLFDLVNPGEKCEYVKFYDNKKSTTEEKITEESTVSSSSKKVGRKPIMAPKDQLFLCLAWLKNGFPRSHVEWLFNTPKSTLSRYVITWINLLYFTLGSLPIWPSRETVNGSMPEFFKNTYPSTRVIIDCTELFCERPSSLQIQSSMYSSYKHHVTYKGLIGIAPSGAVTFVSQLYPGSISDKEIVQRSGMLNEKLWQVNDSVMADRGFLISDDLKPFGVSLNIPAFLKGRDQLSEGEVKGSQTIASVRIHVERAIQRVKKFQILRKEIPLLFHGSINQMWTVCTLLCNLMPPLILKDTKED